MALYRQTFAEINLEAWANNIGLLQKHFSSASFFCPMIKANAYGHGDIELARVLEDLKVPAMGVCLLEEGLKLRSHGIQSEILVFRSFDRAGAEALLDARLTPVVSDWQQLRILAEAVASQKGTQTFHLKFDTGMNRLGFSISEAEDLKKFLQQNGSLRVAGLLTHLYHAEDALDLNGRSVQQLRSLMQMESAFNSWSPVLHALNSGGCSAKYHLQQTQGHEDHPLLARTWGVRPGIMTYGYDSLGYLSSQLKPVMNFKSEVCVVRHLKQGETVSYSGTFTATKPSIIFVIPVGYADGYHRLLSNRGTVLVRGARLPVVGNVCMDYMMVDATSLFESGRWIDPERFVGEEVLLFGADKTEKLLSAEEIGKAINTISYEMLTSVSSRVPRVYQSFSAQEKHKNGELR